MGRRNRGIPSYFLKDPYWIAAHVLVAVLVWFFLTTFWVQRIFGLLYANDSAAEIIFEYAFLPVVACYFALLVAVMRGRIRRQRNLRKILKLPDEARRPAWVWGVMFQRIANECRNPFVRRRYQWVAWRLKRHRNQQQLYSIDRLPIRASLRMAVLPLLLILLSWPAVEARLGEAFVGIVAQARDRTSEGRPYFLKAQICPWDSDSVCTSLRAEQWAGGTVFYRATDMPAAGRLRFALDNWPRTERALQLSSRGPGFAFEPGGRKTATQMSLRVHGFIVEIPYLFEGPDAFNAHLELNYTKRQGDPLESAMVAGNQRLGTAPSGNY